MNISNCQKFHEIRQLLVHLTETSTKLYSVGLVMIIYTKIGEFKVVCLTKYGNNCCRSDETQVSGVHLYTLGSDTWITLESIPYVVYGQSDVAQEPVDGVIHWEAYRTFEGSKVCNRVILSFDFEKEMFQEMPWPDLLSEVFRTHLCVLGGSLCICGFNRSIGVEVWELKDCEGRRSWNKLFTVDMIKHFGLVTTVVPLQSLKNRYWFSCPSI